MNDFPSTMKSAAIWVCTKVQDKHQGELLVCILANFHFSLPKPWLPNQPLSFTL